MRPYKVERALIEAVEKKVDFSNSASVWDLLGKEHIKNENDRRKFYDDLIKYIKAFN